MSFLKKKKILVTHNGSFHADDLFACAVLIIWLKKSNQSVKIIRTRDKETIDKADYVFDVGGIYDPVSNRFDHHQKEGAGARANGIPYASCGLAWKHFGLDTCDNNMEVWNLIDRKIFSSLDAIDNGVDIISPKFKDVMPYSADQPFLIYSPTWEEIGINEDLIFKQQVMKVVEVLEREIYVALTDHRGKQLINEAYTKATDKRIIEVANDFPRYLFQDTLSLLPEPIYFIYPSGHSSSWKVEAIRKNSETFESRKMFPESWRGLLDRDPKLVELTGVPDVNFCHRGGFYMTVDSKEGAIALAKKALLA
ncbi:MAG: MYG1 family protein [Patescibacteria group bacterium]